MTFRPRPCAVFEMARMDGLPERIVAPEEPTPDDIPQRFIESTPITHITEARFRPLS